jgi:membrane protein YqaA with SNARE-associated domain
VQWSRNYHQQPAKKKDTIIFQGSKNHLKQFEVFFSAHMCVALFVSFLAHVNRSWFPYWMCKKKNRKRKRQKKLTKKTEKHEQPQVMYRAFVFLVLKNK